MKAKDITKDVFMFMYPVTLAMMGIRSSNVIELLLWAGILFPLCAILAVILSKSYNSVIKIINKFF